MWDIPELFQLVLEEFRLDEDIDAHLCNMALVSRFFWEQTIPMYWECVPARHQVKDVLQIFPLHRPLGDLKPDRQVSCAAHTQMYGPMLTICGKHWVSAREDARWGLYGSFVKYLEIETPVEYDEEFFNLLSQKPLGKIFPNLRSLEIGILCHPQSPVDFFQDLMLPLQLRTLKITLDEDAMSSDMIRALTATVHRVRRDLRDFNLIGPESEEANIVWTGHQDDITQLIHDLPRLSILNLENIEEGFAERWTLASDMEDLEQMTIISTRVPVSERYSFPTHGFGKLIGVDVGRIPVHAFEKVLASIQSSELQTLSLYAEPKEDGEGAMDLTGRLSGHFKRWSWLKYVQLDFGGGVVNWEDILPLLSCREMEEISLTFIGSSAIIKDGDLKSMAQAWPLLEKLEIKDLDLEDGHDTYSNVPPAATLHGLIPLAQHCPSLNTLSISVAVHGVGEEHQSLDVVSNVENLNLGWSWADPTDSADKLDDVGAFIVKMWPNQERAPDRTLWLDSGRDEQQTDTWAYIWEIVDARLTED